MYQIFANAAIPVLVVIVFGLARRYAPASATAISSPPPLVELESRFSVTQWIVGAAMLGIGFLIFITLHRVLVIANQYFASLDGPAKFLLLPQSAIWFFLPGFAGLALTWDLTLWAWSVFGSKQVALQYEYWSNEKAGFNATRVLRIITTVIVLPIAVLTALALPEHDSLQEAGIRSHGYGLVVAKTFDYSSARTLAVIGGFRDRDGRLTKRAGCVLYFADGHKWSSAEVGDFKPTVDSTLLSFLEAKTGLRPKYAETEAEINGGN
jgi:hypothetical protein